MKTQTTPLFCLLPVLLVGTACTSLQPTTSTISETVIESLLPSPQVDQPWRLDSAWQKGGLGGAVLRSASIEHVVRQVDQKLWLAAVQDDENNSTNRILDNIQISQIDDDPLLIERAWRKYCHHQLDMTPEEHTLIAHTPIPHHILSHGCQPGSLKK